MSSKEDVFEIHKDLGVVVFSGPGHVDEEKEKLFYESADEEVSKAFDVASVLLMDTGPNNLNDEDFKKYIEFEKYISELMEPILLFAVVQALRQDMELTSDSWVKSLRIINDSTINNFSNNYDDFFKGGLNAANAT